MQIKSFLQAPMEGVVLQTYGSGNVPDRDCHMYLFEELKAACDRGVIVINCTQCSKGLVKEKYSGGIVSASGLSDILISGSLFYGQRSEEDMRDMLRG